jgi:hypothetical protein
MCAWGVLGIAEGLTLGFTILFGTCALGGAWVGTGVGTRGTGVVLTPTPPRTLRDLLCARLACCRCASCLCCCSIACQTLVLINFHNAICSVALAISIKRTTSSPILYLVANYLVATVLNPSRSFTLARSICSSNSPASTAVLITVSALTSSA